MNIPVQMSEMHHVTRTICGITAILERALSICQITWCSDETFLVETKYLCLQLISTHAPLSVMLPCPAVSLENKRDTNGTHKCFEREKCTTCESDIWSADVLILPLVEEFSVVDYPVNS